MLPITRIVVRPNASPCAPGARHGSRAGTSCLSALPWRFCVAAFIAGILLAPGCTVCQQARRTVCDEPASFSAILDRKRSVKTYREWADMAWCEERNACPAMPTSEPYALGFSDGFSSFVYAGGSGEPPPVPPRQYWNVCWRSPEGHAASDDWYAGYRHGARVARDGGFRDRAVIHSSLSWTGGDDAPPGEMLLNPPEDLGPPPAPTPEGAMIGPVLEDSSLEELPGQLNQKESSEETTPSDPKEPPADTLPAPPLEPDQTNRDSAAVFKSALRSAADRHETKSDSDHAVKSEVLPASTQELRYESSRGADRGRRESSLDVLD